MKQTIFHKCGHTRDLDMGLSSRQNRINLAEQFGKDSCPPCELKEMKKFEIDHGLPELTGTQKQITWATKIRHIKLIGQYSGYWDKKNSDAKFWIDNRNRFRQPTN